MRSAVIASAESLSHPVDLGDGKFLGLSLPAGWNASATSITFQGSADGVVWQDLYDDEGNEVTATVAAGRSISFSSLALALAPWRFIRIRSGTAASAVTQEGNAAAKRVFDFGGSKTLTVTSGVKGIASNGIVVEFANAADDTLAVSKVDSLKKIIIAVANTTASKNADTLIEDAVQALSTVGGIDVSGMTVVGSTEYDAAPVARPAASAMFSFVNKTLTFTSGVTGPAGNAISVSIDQADDDTLAVSNPDGTHNILVKLAGTTASKNADTLIESAVQALSTVGPVGDTIAVSAMTVTGNAAYDSAPVAAAKAEAVVDFGDSKTLTFTAGVGGVAGNGMYITVDNNTSDALSVTNPAGTNEMLIKLATTTASKNADTAIQAAVQNLATVGDYDVSAMTVAGSTEYDAAPIAGTKAVSTVNLYDVDGETYTSLGVLTITSGEAGPDGQAVLHNLLGIIEVNDTDDLAIVEGELAGGLPNVTLKLANATPGNNSAAAIQQILRTVTCPLYAAHITGLTVEADATWTASPPIAFDAPDKQTANGTNPVASEITSMTADGADIPSTTASLSGGTEAIVPVSANLAGGEDIELVLAIKD